jgi:Recombination endonuclease VII.
MCTTHLYRTQKGLPIDAPVRQYERDGTCSVEGCGRRRRQDNSQGASGEYCGMHYRRMRDKGEVGGPEPVRARKGRATWLEPEAMRAKHLLENYGLTLDDYDRMYTEQDGRCRSCRKDKSVASPRSRSQRWMVVDHDHRCCAGKQSCGKCVRGLLCQHCNRGSGFFGDDPDALERHAAYLRATARFPALT